MKPFAGLLIEYFVIGSVAVLWFLPMIVSSALFKELTKESLGVIAAAVVPALYVIGMTCDGIGSAATHWFKRRIEASVWNDPSEKRLSSQLIHAYAVYYAPALAEEIEARSTRDRIARGSLVASIPLLFIPLGAEIEFRGRIIAALLVASVAWLWVRLQTLSAKYEYYAWRVLREKHQLLPEAVAQHRAAGDAPRAARP
jgi:hypothetical protein